MRPRNSIHSVPSIVSSGRDGRQPVSRTPLAARKRHTSSATKQCAVSRRRSEARSGMQRPLSSVTLCGSLHCRQTQRWRPRVLALVNARRCATRRGRLITTARLSIEPRGGGGDSRQALRDRQAGETTCVNARSEAARRPRFGLSQGSFDAHRPRGIPARSWAERVVETTSRELSANSPFVRRFVRG